METNRVGTGSYVVAGLGFIPAIGVLFAIAAIIMGLIKIRSGGGRLIILGCLGILFTVAIYGTLFYEGFMVRGGIYDEMRGQLARTTITDLVKSIEYYKLTQGRYPDSLVELQSSMGTQSFTVIYDSSVPPSLQGISKTTFFYQLTPDKTHYYLLGAGMDRKPFTPDDVLPVLSEQERVKTGLLINPASLPAPK